MKILVKGKVETVSRDRVKPAHLDNEPAIGTEKQRKTQIQRIRQILRQFEGNRLSNRIPKRRELSRKRKHRHSLWRFNMVRIWLLRHSIMLIE